MAFIWTFDKEIGDLTIINSILNDGFRSPNSHSEKPYLHVFDTWPENQFTNKSSLLTTLAYIGCVLVNKAAEAIICIIFRHPYVITHLELIAVVGWPALAASSGLVEVAVFCFVSSFGSVK